MSWNPHPVVCLYQARQQPLRRFLSELLLQEGYLCADHVELGEGSDVPALLAGRALALVSAENLPANQRQELAQWVRGGGAAVLIQPPDDLIEALGLEWAETTHAVYHTSPPGYAHLTEHPWTEGVSPKVLQMATPCFLRRVKGQRPLALISLRKEEASTFPAVFEADCGRGQVVVFWFELGQALVRLRQGDPLRATTGVLGDPLDSARYKTGALFEGLLDPAMRDVPQGDVWADLLVTIIRQLTDAALPLPRLWHYPGDSPALTFLDGDSDAYDWDVYAELVEPCVQAGVPYTLNLLPEHLGVLDRSKIDHWLARGNDFQLHYWPGTPTPTIAQEARTIAEHAALFRAKTGLMAVAGRAHSVLWPGYTEMAEILAGNGFRMETNFFPFRGYQYGYLGSARPARFIRADGQIISVMQQPTVFMDDPMAGEKSILPARSPQYAYDTVRRIYQEAATRYHGVICTCLHPVPPRYEHYRKVQQAMRSALIDATRELGLQAVTARGWSGFCEARRQVDVRWADGAWSIDACAAIEGVTVHQPTMTGGVQRGGLRWNSRTLNLSAGQTVAMSSAVPAAKQA